MLCFFFLLIIADNFREKAKNIQEKKLSLVCCSSDHHRELVKIVTQQTVKVFLFSCFKADVCHRIRISRHHDNAFINKDFYLFYHLLVHYTFVRDRLAYIYLSVKNMILFSLIVVCVALNLSRCLLATVISKNNCKLFTHHPIKLLFNMPQQ